jgi:hypothetical protein
MPADDLRLFKVPISRFNEEVQRYSIVSAIKVAMKVYLPVRLSGRLIKSPNKALQIFLLLIRVRRFNSCGVCF